MGYLDELKALEAELAGPELNDFLAFIRLNGRWEGGSLVCGLSVLFPPPPELDEHL